MVTVINNFLIFSNIALYITISVYDIYVIFFTFNFFKVHENNTKLRRLKPMPEINDEYNLLSREKTIYCVSNVTSPIQYYRTELKLFIYRG